MKLLNQILNKISSTNFNQVHDSLGALKLIASALTSDLDILSSFCVLAFDEVPNRNFTTKEYINRKADAKNGLNLVQKHLIAKEVSKLLKDASAFYDSELPSLIKTQADFKRPENVKVFKTAKFGDVALIDNKYHLVNPLTKTVTAEYIVLAADANFAKLHELIAKYRDEKDVKLTELDGQMVLTGAPEVINELEHLIKDIGYYCEAVDESTGVDGEIPEYSLKIFTDMKQAEPEFDIEKAAAKHKQVGEDSKFSYWLQLEDNYEDEGYLDSKKVGDHVGFFYVTEKGTQAPALLVSQLGFSGDGLTAQRTYPMKSKEPGKTYLYEEYGYTDDDFAEVYNFLNDGLKSVSPEMNKKNLDGLTVDNVDATNPNLEKDNPMLNSESATEEVVEKTSAEKPVENKAEEKIDFEKDLMEAGESKGEKDKVNETQLAMGKEVEKEHTTNPEIAEKITRDHLEEIPDYYTHLKEMEDNAKTNDAVKSSYAPFMTVDATKKEEIKIYSGDHFIGTCKTITAAFEDIEKQAGPGAGVTFNFKDCELEPTGELGVYKINNLVMESAYDTKKVEGDAGTIKLDLDDLVKSLDKYYPDVEIKISAIDDVSVDNYVYSRGWTRSDLGENGFLIDDKYGAECTVTFIDKDGDEVSDNAYCGVDFTPSTETITAYQCLDEEDDIESESAKTEDNIEKKADGEEDNVWVVEKTSAPTIDDQLTLDIFYVVNKNTHVVAHDAGFEPFIFPTQEDAQKHADKLNSQKEASATSEVKKEAGESYGWVVNSEDAWNKLMLWEETVGAEQALRDVAKAMGDEELSECLAYIFRMNDFKEGCSDTDDEDSDVESAKEENIEKKAEDNAEYHVEIYTKLNPDDNPEGFDAERYDHDYFKTLEEAKEWANKHTTDGKHYYEISLNDEVVESSEDNINKKAGFSKELIDKCKVLDEKNDTPENYVMFEIINDEIKDYFSVPSELIYDQVSKPNMYIYLDNNLYTVKEYLEISEGDTSDLGTTNDDINKKADQELKQFDMKQELDGQKEFEKQDDFSQVSVPEEKEDTSEVTETMEAKPEETKGESFSASEFGNNMAYIQQNNPEAFKSIMNNLKQLMVGDQQKIYDFLENWASHNFQDFTAMTREDPTYARHSQYQEQLKNNVLPKLKEMSEYKQAMEEKVSAEKGE